MRLIIALCASTLFFMGCASAPKNSAPINPAYIGDSNSGGFTSQQIKNNLSRSGFGGIYEDAITAYIFTGALNEAQEKEKGLKNFDSPEDIKKNIEKLHKLFIADKTCFAVQVTSIGPIEVAMFKNWRGKVEQPQGVFQEVTFLNTTGVDSVPEVTSAPLVLSAKTQPAWVNSSYACLKNKLDFKKEFSLHMLPQLGNRKNIRLTWTQ